MIEAIFNTDVGRAILVVAALVGAGALLILNGVVIGRKASRKGRSGLLHGLNALVDPIGAELHLKQLKRKGPEARNFDRSRSTGGAKSREPAQNGPENL